jgi:nicotinamidase-related amidase
MGRRKIDGKIYETHGPYHCPHGTPWSQIHAKVRRFKEDGAHVRVLKTKTPKSPFGNTHRVYICTRKA